MLNYFSLYLLVVFNTLAAICMATGCRFLALLACHRACISCFAHCPGLAYQIRRFLHQVAPSLAIVSPLSCAATSSLPRAASASPSFLPAADDELMEFDESSWGSSYPWRNSTQFISFLIARGFRRQWCSMCTVSGWGAARAQSHLVGEPLLITAFSHAAT